MCIRDSFNTLLWDAGLQASMAVRSTQECTQAAADITVVTALILSLIHI